MLYRGGILTASEFLVASHLLVNRYWFQCTGSNFEEELIVIGLVVVASVTTRRLCIELRKTRRSTLTLSIRHDAQVALKPDLAKYRDDLRYIEMVLRKGMAV